MRKLLLRLFTVGALLAGVLPAMATEGPLFVETDAFATKTGFRGVFVWEAADPVKARVHYGTSATSLGSTIDPLPGAPDTAGIAIADGLSKGTTYFWQVEDLITGERSEVKSFDAVNAYEAWDGSTYTLDMLVQLDSESLPPDVPADAALEDIAQGVSIFAERLYDALDGYARLGDVVVTDTELDYAGSVPFFQGTGCSAVPGAGGNLADVLVQTTVPFDSHTFGGWSINKPCTSFYVGRVGQLIIPWEDDLHFGYVATHEMMHYAFNAPDLYSAGDLSNPRASGCWNLDWDGSVMHNSGGWAGDRWELTELDRDQERTPCDHQHSNKWTWPELRTRYTNVPDIGPQNIIDTEARGNADGGALDIKILDRTGSLSSLENFVPDDTPEPEVPTISCTATEPVVVDPQGDARSLVRINATDNEPALDILEGRMDWDETAEVLTLTIEVDDLQPDNPASAPTGISFNFNFRYNEVDYTVEAARRPGGSTQFRFGQFVLFPRVHLVPITGSFDDATDKIILELPNSALTSISEEPFADGDGLSEIDIVSRRGVATAVTTAGPATDTTNLSCPYTIGEGAVGQPVDVEPDGAISPSNPIHTWTGSTLADAVIPLTGTNATLCDGSIDNENCDRHRVDVTLPSGGDTLTFTVDTLGANAYIMYVYDPAGQSFGDATGLSNVNTVTGEAVTDGIYTVVLRPWVAAAAEYRASAVLGTPVPDADGTLATVPSTYSWTGAPTTDSYFVFGCDGLLGFRASREACDEEVLDVTVPTGSTTTVLDVSVSADNPDVNDFDFVVFGPDGAEVGGSGTQGTHEHDVIKVIDSGRYTVQVRAWLTAEATYEATAILREEQESDFTGGDGGGQEPDGEISVGDTYSWDSSVPATQTGLLFYCQGLAQGFCDNTFVQVNVPVGGATLTVTVTAVEALDDLDVDVYDPSGDRLTDFEGRTFNNPEVITLQVTNAGIYRIAVVGFLAIDGRYQGQVSLSP